MFTYFANRNNAVSTLTLVEHTTIDDRLNPTGVVTQIFFAPDQARFNLEVKRSKFGVVFEILLTANIPRLQAGLKLNSETKNKRFVFFIKDNNGSQYAFGKKNKGYKLEIGAEVSNTLNTIVLSCNVTTSVIFELTEELEQLNSTDYVITNTIILACDNGEIITENKTVSLNDGDTFTHSLNSTEVAVSFFENGVQRLDIAYEIINTGLIKAYIPLPDQAGYTFVGEVFIEKRATL
jgi:hypothetical protein